MVSDCMIDKKENTTGKEVFFPKDAPAESTGNTNLIPGALACDLRAATSSFCPQRSLPLGAVTMER